MLQLRRIRLESVGHPNARFAPLQLDLVDDEHRPTHTVVWLRNGGGKSSLLNLLFAVVRPHRREFLGGNDDGKDRRLGDYVLDGDTSHVSLEWGVQGARQPALVTGMVLEWRDRRRVDDQSRLHRLWYAFVPSDHRAPGLLDVEPTLTFDTIPRSEDGRRLSLRRFRDRLRSLAATDPSLRLVAPASQAEWRRELEQHDLDPEVLRYQLQMNREEGGASELFKRRCRTTSDFVDLLLELAVADERTERVADVYSRYADELARRPDVERNRDFVAGALERLAPLSEAVAAQTRADAAVATVLREAAGAGSALRGSAANARAAARGARAEQAQALARADELMEHRDAEHARHAALLAIAARLDVADADARHDAAVAALADAEARLAAARLLDPLARRRATDAEIDAIDARLRVDGSADGQRHRARVALARRLRADAQVSATAADERRRAATDCQRQADLAAAEAEAAAADRGRHEQHRSTLAAQHQAWHDRRRQLRQRGLIADAEDVTTALARAAAALGDAQTARGQRRRQAAALGDAVRDAYGEVSRLDAAIADASAERTAAAQAFAQLRADASVVTSDARLREVAESDAIDVWHAGPTLAARLEAEVEEADRRLADAAVTVAGDRAALVGLQTDGLLPPRAAVVRVVALLAEHGVSAVAGWRHVAELVPADARANVVQQAPAIVDGVVVADDAALARARDVLDGLAEPLRSVVLVAAPPRATDAARPVAAPVDPALYDRAHAERARERVRSRLANADRERAAVTAARSRDAALADRVRRLLDAYPDPRRSELADAAARAARAHDRLQQERAAAATQLERLEVRRDEAAATSDDDARVERLAAALTQLRALDADAVDPATIAAVEAEVAAAHTRVREAGARVAALRTQAADHLVAFQRHRDERTRLLEEAATLTSAAPDEATPDEATPDADAAAGASADVLRRRLAVLQADTDAPGPEGLLDERRRLLLEQRAQLERTLAAAEAPAAQAAAAVLSTPDGRDAAARERTLARAVAARDAALETRAETGERLRAARDAAGAAGTEDDGVDDRAGHTDHATSTPERARSAASAAADAAARAEAAAAGERAEAAAAERRAAAHQRTADAFEHLAELVTIELRARPASAGDRDDQDTAIAVPDQPDLARDVVDQLRVRIGDAAGAADRAARTVGAAAAEVRRFVTADRFAVLDGPLRSRLADDPAAVADNGAALVDQLHIRLAQCEQKLEELASHRRLLVREIAADTQRGLWLLRQADQVSALPDGFGDWSDERFLQIRFATPAVDDELIARLETMVDELVDGRIRPAGVPLLQRAVHAAVGPDGFGVRILKPNPALVPQRVPVTELATFSGGEQLTAAILLYCTLARLRAQARQVQSAAGVLTLDNPIGKSSNVTLLQLQRRVADAMGVQLVYTTAVDDREAVGVLPHWIRLRNERRDARSGDLHVERADDGAHGDRGQVDATRLWRRSDALAAPSGRG